MAHLAARLTSLDFALKPFVSWPFPSSFLPKRPWQLSLSVYLLSPIPSTPYCPFLTSFPRALSWKMCSHRLSQGLPFADKSLFTYLFLNHNWPSCSGYHLASGLSVQAITNVGAHRDWENLAHESREAG